MFRKIAEGDVFSTTKKCATSGPRTAILPDGRIICTFMVNSAGGANDFVPMAAYSPDGAAWGEAKEIWPSLTGKMSTFVSVRPTGDGRVCLGGKQWIIDAPGEAFWSDEANGMKDNKLVFSLSDDGVSFPLPTAVDLPFYGSAENPGGMLADADGALHLIYSPYPTIRQLEATDTRCMVHLVSRDGGKSFAAEKFAIVPAPSLYAESWLTRLSDGRLFVSTWQTASPAAPNQYLVSDGPDFDLRGPFPQPVRGQSTGICPGKDGSVYIAYNQRKEQPAGVWLAMERPEKDAPGLIANEPVWQAESVTQSGSSGDFSQWTDFAFGEPHVSLMPDDTLLVVLWYQQGDKKGIRYVRLAQESSVHA